VITDLSQKPSLCENFAARIIPIATASPCLMMSLKPASFSNACPKVCPRFSSALVFVLSVSSCATIFALEEAAVFMMSLRKSIFLFFILLLLLSKCSKKL